MMTTIRMWKDADTQRPWAEVGNQGREHLLAQLLHGNLCDVGAADQALVIATNAATDPAFTEDLGFFDSVAVYASNGRITLEHVIEAYGEFDVDANALVQILEAWRNVLMCRGAIEVTADLQ